MVKMKVLCLCWLLSALAQGESHLPSSVKSLSDWRKQVETKLEADGDFPLMGFPYKIAFVPEKQGSQISFFPMEKSAFEKSCYFRLPDVKNIEWAHQINESLQHEASYSYSEKAILEELFKLNGTNFLVITSESGDWQLVGYEKKNSVYKKYPQPKKMEPENQCLWLTRALGYNAVVVDIREGYVLVASRAELLQKQNMQGVLLEDMQDTLFMEGDNLPVKGILELRNSAAEENFGVFTSLLDGLAGNGVQVGDKVLLVE